jgi:ribosome-binding factor A
MRWKPTVISTGRSASNARPSGRVVGAIAALCYQVLQCLALTKARLPGTLCIVKRDNEGAGYRHQRLEVSIAEELRLLLRDDVSDPDLDRVGVTAVALSSDYKNAKVHFVIARGHSRAKVESALERATAFRRRRLADSIELKRTPDLRFVFEAEIDMGPTD